MSSFIFNRKHFHGIHAQYEVKYLSEDLWDRMKKIWMHLLHERQRSNLSWHICMGRFQSKCQLQHALKNITELVWARAEAQICADCPERLRALQPFLNTICCSMYSQSHARTAGYTAAQLSHPCCGCIQAWHLHRKFKTSGSQVLFHMQCFLYKFYEVQR